VDAVGIEPTTFHMLHWIMRSDFDDVRELFSEEEMMVVSYKSYP
jgi:hypothetical protein